MTTPDRFTAWWRMPALLLVLVLAGATSVWLLAHSGLASFGGVPLPGPLPPLAAPAVAPAGPVSLVPAPAAAGLTPPAAVVTAQPPALLPLHNAPRGGSTWVADLSARRASPAPSAGDADQDEPDEAADPAAAHQLSLPLDALFVPGQAAFSDEGAALLRQKLRGELGPAATTGAVHFVQLRVIVPEDAPEISNALIRRYQERTVRMLRLLGALARDAVTDLVAPGAVVRDALGAGAGATEAPSADDASGEDAEESEDVPRLVLVLRLSPPAAH